MKLKFKKLFRRILPWSNTLPKIQELRFQLDRMEHKLTLLFDDKFPNTGERQVHTHLENVRVDHRARYSKAISFLNGDEKVLDIACGIGYGSFMIAREKMGVRVTGVDISDKAIQFAERYYSLPNIRYICGDCLKVDLAPEVYDVVVSFETIEHIENAPGLLARLNTTLKEQGVLILSTPNEVIMPFNKDQFPYHVRHYSRTDLEKMLENNGFIIERVFCQKDRMSGEIHEGWDGKFNIVVARKTESS